jgi:ribosomal protein L25 (general stress protein Ctc)
MQDVVAISFDGKVVKAVMREVQRDSLTGAITHVDFGELA